MEADRELILEDARSIREREVLWTIARYAQITAESLDARIEEEEKDLHGLAEVEELREVLEHLHALSLDLHQRGSQNPPAVGRGHA